MDARKPSIYILAVRIKARSEFFPKKILFGQYDGLINEQKQRNHYADVEKRIGQDAYTQQHQYVSYIEWVSAMTENSFCDQSVRVGLPFFSASYDVGQSDGEPSDQLSSNGDDQPKRHGPEIQGGWDQRRRRKEKGRIKDNE